MEIIELFRGLSLETRLAMIHDSLIIMVLFSRVFIKYYLIMAFISLLSRLRWPNKQPNGYSSRLFENTSERLLW